MPDQGSHGGRVVRTVVEAMTMPFAVEVVGAGEAEAGEAIRAFQADLEWAEATFSLWRPDSPLARFNRGEVSLDECPPAVGEVVAECERYREETDGYFDARRPDGVLDPTGIVKTWAVVRASRRLDALDAAGWMVGASGDVVVSGVSEASGPWRVGIADPRLTGSPEGRPVLDVIALGGRHRALATSGTAQHGQHIWNPRTGEGEAALVQASVVGADLVECDAWATAIIAGGREVALAAQRGGLEVLTIPDAESTGPLRGEASPGWPSLGAP
ncbi:MAG: FAD:protein FMN transferase [Demequinaceae bacterium]|nr:FAD:protein FMN transferase [Demequinaceae bacterium]